MMHQAMDVGFKMVVTIVAGPIGWVDFADRFPALGGPCNDVLWSGQGVGADVAGGLECLSEGHGLNPFDGL